MENGGTEDAPRGDGPSLKITYSPPRVFNDTHAVKTGTFGQPEAKVHLGQAWRIEFSYRNIHEH